MATTKKKVEWIDIQEQRMEMYRVTFYCYPNEIEDLLEGIRQYSDIEKVEKEA